MRIKALTEKYSEQIYKFKYGFFLFRWCRNIVFFIEKSKRITSWAKFLWNKDYDFDGQTLYGIIEFKLSRLYKALKEDEHHVQEQDDMEALSLAMTLARRLDTDYHDAYYSDKHTQKWGELVTWTEPVDDGSGYSRFMTSRPKAGTDAEKSQERKEFLEGYHQALKDRERDCYILFTIIQKYLDKWWC